MELLTDKEICEWMGWKLINRIWHRPEWDGTFETSILKSKTPGFSTEQPWFDYVVHDLRGKNMPVEILLFADTTTVRIYKTPAPTKPTPAIATASEPKLPDAFRAALTKLVLENK